MEKCELTQEQKEALAAVQIEQLTSTVIDLLDILERFRGSLTSEDERIVLAAMYKTGILESPLCLGSMPPNAEIKGARFE